ncbi:DNA-3-methyladenine glycosylase I [Alkalihalophilus marmarensis]|uniref:DNA-3-methyladenine glycosylase n=1 Tax=Alkalihalophilus marmarensis DSM 21297 TaxID=1188261 RepID=U6SU29_9BACI|nr:DNA-3-methyladenine glycosylase I [Alkalihalophilus marmarensis]ERN54852.1 DNA-3-methyladenine glycosylase [Alkalihalophilus marmarensis DSM 21297]
MNRCKWAKDDPLMIDYHDHEWGRIIREDESLFEALSLEVFQAGLSWRTVLHKRERFRIQFHGFNIEKVASMTPVDVDRLLNDATIIRHRRKIEATIVNAEILCNLLKKENSFYEWIQKLPKEKEAACKALSKLFKHVGPTTVESFFMAIGYFKPVHDTDCFLHQKGSMD